MAACPHCHRDGNGALPRLQPSESRTSRDSRLGHRSLEKGARRVPDAPPAGQSDEREWWYAPRMSTLREIGPVRQVRGEPRRRWFFSERCDLIVWLDERGEPEGFQFCYDKDAEERALSWRPQVGVSHMKVDKGRSIYGRGGGTPFLVPDGRYDAARMLRLFEAEAALVPPEVVGLVVAKLRELAAA